MTARKRIGLGGRLLAILLAVVVVDLLVNTILFDRAQDVYLREDDAERVSQHLVVTHRMMARTPPAERADMARMLSTPRFTVTWSATAPYPANVRELASLRRRIEEFAPELQGSRLHLRFNPRSGSGDLAGMMTLPDASIISFRTHSRFGWSLDFGRMAALTLPSVLLVLLAWGMFRAALRPLRGLVKATSEVGAANPSPIEETGQAEVRHLIRAFNAMQQRIHQLLASGSQTLLAIGHDLRTPLARVRLRIENAGIDDALREDINRDIEEMLDLLRSLQAYIETGSDSVPAERIDIASMMQTIVDNASDRGADVDYIGPQHREIMARPVWIRRAISNLVENAIAYAGGARVFLREDGEDTEVVVEDDGPGIPESRLVEVLQPFIRLDNARARNTAGMGLGLPIVDRAVKAEGGTLHLANKAGGGLRVTIRLPARLPTRPPERLAGRAARTITS